MVAEKSVLQKIREKELELSIKVDEARRDSEQIFVDARKEASEMIENSEREGKETAEEYYRKEMERINAEIDQLRKRSDEKAMSVRMDGERNLQSAIGKIVKVVLME